MKEEKKIVVGIVSKSDRRIISAAKLFQHINPNVSVIIYYPIMAKNVESNCADLVRYQVENKVCFWESIACERSFCDYSFFDEVNIYSRIGVKEVENFVNVNFIELINFVHKVDFVVEGLNDNALTSMVRKICDVEKRPMFQWRYTHFNPRYVHVIDRDNYLCSSIEEAYQSKDIGYRSEVDYMGIYEKNKGESLYFPHSNVEMMQISFDKYQSYEKVDIYRFLARKIRRIKRSLSPHVKKTNAGELANSKFFIYCMHISPEASILGPSPEFADQFQIIKMLRLSLPVGVRLILKIHPGDNWAINYGENFTNKVKAIIGVEFLDECVNLDKVITMTGCVGLATVNGSVVFDAIKHKMPIITFAPTILDIINYPYFVQSYKDLKSTMYEILSGKFSRYEKEKINKLYFALEYSKIKMLEDGISYSWQDAFVEFNKVALDFYKNKFRQ